MGQLRYLRHVSTRVAAWSKGGDESGPSVLSAHRVHCLRTTLGWWSLIPLFFSLPCITQEAVNEHSLQVQHL